MSKMADENVQKSSGFSFNFAKTQTKRPLANSSLREESTKDPTEAKDYVVSVSDTKIESTIGKPEKKELIIPLIKTNRWQLPSEKAGSAIRNGVDSLDNEAVRQIIQETNADREQWDGRSGDGTHNSNRVIPLALQNKVPEGFETEENMDVSLRAEQSTLEDYENVPIEEFGVAMLKGMGWKPGHGIGLRNKQNVTPVQPKLRPKGLGLGADASKTAAAALPPGTAGKDEALALNKGSHVFIEQGPHRGLYGQVEGLDDDNGRVVVLLALSKQTINISELGVRVVTASEYKKESKLLNKEKYERYKRTAELANGKQGEEDGHKRRRHDHKRSNHSSSSRDRGSSSPRHEERSRDDRHHGKGESEERHRKEENRRRRRGEEHREGSSRDAAERHRGGSSRREEGREHHRTEDDSGVKRRKEEKHQEQERKDTGSNGSTTNNERSEMWMRPHLRVRFICKEYKGGRFYKEKVVIEDVSGLDSSMCRTDDGRLLENIPQAYLETVIPKSSATYVMIVQGKYKGKVAEIMENNRTRCEATLQLLPDKDELVKLDYDSICEYAGDISNIMY